MTGIQIQEGLSGRRYQWPPDDPTHVVPSVTTILNNVAKHDWLVPAAGRRVANYAVDNILQWESMPPDDAKKLLAGVARRDWTKKADAGTAAHDAVEAFLNREPVVDLDANLPYLAGALLFLQEHIRRVVHYEQVVYNLTYDYAGRTDLIGITHGGPLAVVDWKTGHTSDEHVLQLNAYAHAEFVGQPDGTRIDLPPIEAGWIVQLPGDGTYRAYPVEISDRAFHTFVAYRTVQKWVDDHQKAAMGAPVAPESDPEEFMVSVTKEAEKQAAPTT